MKCYHRDHYIFNNWDRILFRMCTSCGKSWRMSTRPWNDAGPMPEAKWEEIVEPVEQEPVKEEVAS